MLVAVEVVVAKVVAVVSEAVNVRKQKIFCTCKIIVIALNYIQALEQKDTLKSS